MTNILNSATVAISSGHTSYSGIRPFSPSTPFPEYPFGFDNVSKDTNAAYDAVRESLMLLGLDREHAGTASWNPLGEMISPGSTVVLKPNLVRDFRESNSDHGDCLVANGAVLRAVADYAFIALRPQGRLIIADAPHNDADFDILRRIVGLDAIRDFFHESAGFDLEVLDLRREMVVKVNGVIVEHRSLSGDPEGYVKVDLGEHSAFREVEGTSNLLYGSEYDVDEVRAHQRAGVHEYLIAKTILEADFVISVPKLKTHKKVGLTVNLKNLVGINGNKNWLPHYSEGSPETGGDQFPSNGVRQRLERATVSCFKRWFPRLGPLRKAIAGPAKWIGQCAFGHTDRGIVRSGNWYGNDTAWRMVLDLNRILLYADSNGKLCDTPTRGFLSVVDAIIAGEGNGPLDATPRKLGLVIVGANPVAVDVTCARLIGFDYRNIPMLHRALSKHTLPLLRFDYQDIACLSNSRELNGRLADIEGSLFELTPHFGWRGHVEIQATKG